MKKFLLLYLNFTVFVYSQDLPFHRGVNITNWFQAENPHSIQFNKFSKKDFERIKLLGADVIRLPINLHSMTSGAPDYSLDPLFVYMLDQAVEWAEEFELSLILDNHTFDVTQSTSTDIDKVLIPVWSNMAERYKDRSKYIYYEILNEPHGISDQRWNDIQLATVNAIREIDTVHTIIVGPAGWNSYNNLSSMPVYPDTNLIYTFHFYDLFVFTHQGASWTDPSLVPLSGVPFPYNSSSMPVCPDPLKGTWIENSLNNYMNEGTVSAVQNLINIADNFKNSRNAKLYCGEIGVFFNNAPDEDRSYWYGVIRAYLESNDIAWTIWDYKGAFGLFEKNTDELFDYDLNIPLINALGFNELPQKEFVLTPDSTGFNIYTDLVGENLLAWGGSGAVDFWNRNNPQHGEFSIYWTEASQYNNISFNLKPIKDLSYLASEDYVLDLYIKGSSTEIKIDIRFIDTKEDESDHPWRMRYTLDANNVTYDGEWKHLQIPLKNFTEHGSWDNNTWYNPEGKFDWAAIEYFEIVSEYGNMGTAELWFDDIRIVDPNSVSVQDELVENKNFKLYQNYPNPFNPITKIKYSVPTYPSSSPLVMGRNEVGFVSLKIYDILGREIVTLVNEEKPAGTYEVEFNSHSDEGQNLSSGVYFYKLQAGNYVETKKLILLR